MTIKKFETGNIPTGTTLMYNWDEALKLSGLNLIRQMQDREVEFSAGMIDLWGDAYTDSNGRNNSVTNASAIFDTDKYKALVTETDPFVIIEATAIVDVDDWDINDCDIVQIDTGKWQLSCHTGDVEVQRAQIYKTLFYGTNGTNPRASSTYITSITALKTSIARDVGKKGFLAKALQNTSGEGVATGTSTYTGTFTDTTNNTDCSFWSYVSSVSNSSFSDARTYASFPSGTIVNDTTTASSETLTVDELGTDTSSDEDNNPATIILSLNLYKANNSGYQASNNSSAIILATGDINWAAVKGDANIDVFTYSNIDFYTDNGIPALTATTETIVYLIYHTIPTGTFDTTISTVIGIPMIEDWETGADIQYKLTNTGGDDSGWLSCSNSPIVNDFTAFTAEPDTLIVKLIPKTTSPTAGYPSIKGFVTRTT